MQSHNPIYLRPTILALLMIVSPIQADEGATLDDIQTYLDFATYSDGSIALAQLNGFSDQEILYIDTRRNDQYAKEHIPDAIHIEWRDILSRRNEVPSDKPVVLYCNTGALSSKAQFILLSLIHI